MELNKEAKSLIRYSLNTEENILKLGLLKWKSKLRNFEEKHGMSNKVFFDKFNRGDLGDDKIWFEWLFALKSYEHIKNKLHLINNIRL